MVDFFFNRTNSSRLLYEIQPQKKTWLGYVWFHDELYEQSLNGTAIEKRMSPHVSSKLQWFVLVLYSTWRAHGEENIRPELSFFWAGFLMNFLIASPSRCPFFTKLFFQSCFSYNKQCHLIGENFFKHFELKYHNCTDTWWSGVVLAKFPFCLICCFDKGQRQIKMLITKDACRVTKRIVANLHSQNQLRTTCPVEKIYIAEWIN